MSETKETDQQEREMLNMFASVWVKVEVGDEDDGDGEVKNPLEIKSGNFEKKKRVPTKVLHCNICEYTTPYKNCLEVHVLAHQNLKPYSCNQCEYSTRYPTSLQRHVIIQHQFKQNEHADNTKYKCTECNYSSFFKWNLNAHKRKHKLDKEYKCEKCSYSTAYRNNYIKHSKVHSKQQVIFKCDKCPFVTKYEGHITRHLAKIHNEVSDKANRCDLCDFSTRVKWRLNMHKQRSKNKELLKCPHCEFETHYMCESKKHKVMHFNKIYGIKNRENETKIDVPYIMPEQVPQSQENPQHQTVHEKNNHYTLDPNCEVDWNNIQVIECSSKDTPFQCIMCKYTSRFKASVQRHFQRHHTGSQNRPYKCCNCDFSTKTKDQIALHNKRSQSDIQLFCNECEFNTFFKCQIVMHQKCHYAHKCSICNYSCKHKYEIQRHFSMIHMGNGLKCRFCDYQASRKESLLCHETIHTGDKPFKCPTCEYTSVRKSLLETHIKRYHCEIKKDTIVVSDNKIQSLKISVSENMMSQNLIQEIRDNNLTIEEIINANDSNDMEDIIVLAENNKT